jgi:Protein of unknown function (DUF4013)
MENLERSFRYPFSGEDWKPRMAFGGILYILAAVLGFIPWIGGILYVLGVLIPLGYSYKIFRDHLRGGDGPLPNWGEWGDLFARGWAVFLVSLGYWIIPGILYWLGKALWHGGGIGAFLGVLFLILGIGVGLVAFFLFPMALAFFSRENESFASAFRWSGIVEKIWIVQREYFTGWVATLIFFLVLVLVRSYFLYLGWILYALGVFYLSVVAADFFGRVCRESMEVRR